MNIENDNRNCLNFIEGHHKKLNEILFFISKNPHFEKAFSTDALYHCSQIIPKLIFLKDTKFISENDFNEIYEYIFEIQEKLKNTTCNFTNKKTWEIASEIKNKYFKNEDQRQWVQNACEITGINFINSEKLFIQKSGNGYNVYLPDVLNANYSRFLQRMNYIVYLLFYGDMCCFKKYDSFITPMSEKKSYSLSSFHTSRIILPDDELKKLLIDYDNDAFTLAKNLNISESFILARIATMSK